MTRRFRRPAGSKGASGDASGDAAGSVGVLAAAGWAAASGAVPLAAVAVTVVVVAAVGRARRRARLRSTTGRDEPSFSSFPTGDTPAGIINRAQRPAPDVPLWQRVHPLTCGLCDVPERDTDQLIAFDLPGDAVELRCRRHPSYRQVLSVADPIHPSNLRRPQAG